MNSNYGARIIFLLLAIAVMLVAVATSGCDSIPIDSIGFCYQDEDGKKYCGDIGFKQADSNKSASVVVEKTDTDTGKKETLYTFTGDQINQLYSLFPGVAGAGVSRAKALSNNHLDSYQKLKEIAGRTCR